MIQANELRLKNWAIHPASGTEIQLTEIDIIQIMERSQDGLNQNYEPIELTPEWLTRAGFVEKNNGWYEKEFTTDCIPTEVECFSINIQSKRAFIKLIGYIDAPFDYHSVTYFARLISSVHLLQNAFYSVTGTELEFK